MVRTTASLIKYGIDKQMAKQKAKREAVSRIPIITINLRNEVKHLQRFDFNDKNYRFLFIDRWFNESQVLRNLNKDSISKLSWYDLSLFSLSVLPITTKEFGGGIYLRFLTIARNIPDPLRFRIYTKQDDEIVMPSSMNFVSKAHLVIAPNTVMINDLRLSLGIHNKNFFTMLFKLEENILNMRIKIVYDGGGISVKNYEEMKANRFYNMVDLPYISPEGSQSLIYAIQSRNKTKGMKTKEAEKLKLDKLTEGKINQEWVTDYIEIAKGRVEKEKKFCPQCGKKFRYEGLFCPQCGKKYKNGHIKPRKEGELEEVEVEVMSEPVSDQYQFQIVEEVEVKKVEEVEVKEVKEVKEEEVEEEPAKLGKAKTIFYFCEQCNEDYINKVKICPNCGNKVKKIKRMLEEV